MADINTVIGKYQKPEDIIPALQDIQKEFGYLSEAHLEALSRKTGVALSRISGVATFYTQFRLKPLGKYHIMICRGTACHVNNSEQLQKAIEKKLNIASGEMTKDGLFSLERVNCLGTCARAPVMMINGTVYGELTEAKINAILGGLK